MTLHSLHSRLHRLLAMARDGPAAAPKRRASVGRGGGGAQVDSGVTLHSLHSLLAMARDGPAAAPKRKASIGRRPEAHR